MPRSSDEQTAAKHLQFAQWELDPFCKLKLRERAEKLNVTVATLLRWRNDPLYILRKNQLREASFEKHAGEVDKAVIRKAVDGSFLFCKLFYERKGELVQKHQVVNDDIATMSKETRRKEIDRLIAETTPLESGSDDNG